MTQDYDIVYDIGYDIGLLLRIMTCGIQQEKFEDDIPFESEKLGQGVEPLQKDIVITIES